MSKQPVIQYFISEKTNRYHWRLMAANNEIVCSGQSAGYNSEREMYGDITKLLVGATSEANYHVFNVFYSDKSKRWHWNLSHMDIIVCSSQSVGFADKATAESSVESTKRIMLELKQKGDLTLHIIKIDDPNA